MNFGDIIEYIDGTLDENFNKARRWAFEHKTTFNELVERRNLPKRYFEIGKEPEEPVETLLQKLNRLEMKYKMPRWAREEILSEGSSYSDFTKARAQELEDIAEQIRKGE